MKAVNDFAFRNRTPSGERQSYDWDTLLNGSIYELEAGQDFTGKQASMNVLIHTNAKKRGLKVRTGKNGDNIVLQAYKPDGSAIEPKDTKAKDEVKAEDAPKVEESKPEAKVEDKPAVAPSAPAKPTPPQKPQVNRPVAPARK